MPTMRKIFFDRFGAGQPEVLAERAKVYLLGMPDKDGDVFPPRCNMETKLDKLETEREFLLEMCPNKDKRDTYDTGKECTLVRILLRTLPAEYDAAVKSVRDLTKLRKYGLLGDLTQITNKEDNTRPAPCGVGQLLSVARKEEKRVREIYSQTLRTPYPADPPWS